MINPATFPFEDCYLPNADEYVSMFCNDLGEQMFFVTSPGEKTARILLESASPSPLTVEGGVVPGYFLSGIELTFLAACWDATRTLRHSSNDTDRLDVLAAENEARVIVSLQQVDQYRTCAHCKTRIGANSQGVWHHATLAGRLAERGCRAASFRIKGDWDDTLSKSLAATPY